jgi:hypothetical protein
MAVVPAVLGWVLPIGLGPISPKATLTPAPETIRGILISD